MPRVRPTAFIQAAAHADTMVVLHSGNAGMVRAMATVVTYWVVALAA
jgi:hypothetical protein